MHAESLDGQPVLVTGAGGFIGSHLCERLGALGARTCALSRRPVDAQHAGVRYCAGDCTDRPALARLVGELRPAVIFHLAGMAAAARDPALVWPTFQANLAATVAVLEAAHALPEAPRVVLAGSLEEPDPGTEANSPYAVSKAAASAYGRFFHATFGLPVAIARIFITYGPTRRDLHKLIPLVILSLLDGRAPHLSSGRREVDWIHIDDVVDGLLVLATAPQAVGRTLDIGSGELVSIRALVERIAALAAPPGVAPAFDPALDRPAEQVRRADVARTGREIGWRPRVGLDEGVARTVAWFRTHRSTLSGAPE